MAKDKDTKFNPSDKLTNIKGKSYLEVKWRLVWFREEHPLGTIETELVDHGTGWALMKASVKNEHGVLLATAYKQEVKSDFGDFLEKAETGAVGRALAMAGYGTQFSQELDMPEGKVVDAPVDRNPTREVFKAKQEEMFDGDKEEKKGKWTVVDTEIPCPACGKGTVTEVTNNDTGAVFYGCSAYKEGCKYNSPSLPVVSLP